MSSLGIPRVYSPQLPIDQKYFAGRISLLNQVDSIVKSTEKGKAEHIAICGVHGIGKTSITYKIQQLVPNTCFMAYYAATKEVGSQEFVQDLIQKMNFQYQQNQTTYQKLLSKAKDFPGTVKSFSVLQIGLEVKEGKKSPQIAFMECMANFVRRGFKGIVIIIDEADLLSDDALALIRNSVQELQTPIYKSPTSVIISGSENLLGRLTGKYSPIARLFSGHTLELGPLTEEETFDALSLPAKDSKLRWMNDAVIQVYQWSRGFPFIVQLFGQFSVEHCNGKLVKLADVKKAYLDVIREVGIWYTANWKNDPAKAEIQILLALGDLSSRAKYTAISKKMGEKDIGTALKRLVQKGCLNKDEITGEYYLLHPLVLDFLKVNYLK